ncbi:MAG TPA: DUF2007 domain-containing protein [Blastocatellia bacterium]|nr:DUF2007 domain-containing protein [Blastocatellia bacterium]
MPYCPSCGSEFRAGFTECNSCRVPLVASLDAADDNAADDGFYEDDEAGENALQLLVTLTSASQATYVRHLLDEAEVPSVLRGGHGDDIRSGEPYRIYVDEDYIEAAQETIESFRSPTLVTGQIEGDLMRLQQEMNRLEKQDERLRPQLHAVRASMEKLQSDLNALNRELD